MKSTHIILATMVMFLTACTTPPARLAAKAAAKVPAVEHTTTAVKVVEPPPPIPENIRVVIECVKGGKVLVHIASVGNGIAKFGINPFACGKPI